VSADDISELVRRGSEAGAIEDTEKELLEGVVELSDRIVREVMTPRKDIVHVRESATTADVVEAFVQHGVSRLLVCGTDLDEVKGVVLGKDLLRFVGKSVGNAAWREYVRPAYFVPNTKPVDALLVELRQKGCHLAVVLNEHGGVDGIVTLEDLVEEIVGDIFDEFDHPSDQTLILRDEHGMLTMDASVKVSRLADEFDITIPEGEYDTVAGFILAHLGHLPVPGERLANGDVELTVQTVDHNRIGRVTLRVLRKDPSNLAQKHSNEPQGENVSSDDSAVVPRISHAS
jgi:putative hemolysin